MRRENDVCWQRRKRDGTRVPGAGGLAWAVSMLVHSSLGSDRVRWPRFTGGEADAWSGICPTVAGPRGWMGSARSAGGGPLASETPSNGEQESARSWAGKGSQG